METYKEYGTDVCVVRSIFDGFADYYPKPWVFDPAKPIVRLHEPTYGAEEIEAVMTCLLTTRVTQGDQVATFERALATKLARRHALTCNSGSSANLLAIAALCNQAIVDHLKPGDEVIVPALAWSTTIRPLVQHQLTPVFVDVDPQTFNISLENIKRAITPKTKAVMAVAIYGNPNDPRIEELREDYWVIEDCCEALGMSPYLAADASTFSFYFSHHITTIEGGAVATNHADVNERLRILRAHGWMRDLDWKRRNEYSAKEMSPTDPRFLFIDQGYNLRMTEPQAAMGREQLKKLDGFVGARQAAGLYFQIPLQNSSLFDLQYRAGDIHSYFGFPVIMRDGSKKGEICEFLNRHNIETRQIASGNMAIQPGMRYYPHRIVGSLDNATRIMRDGFSWGCHQAMNQAACDYVLGKIAEYGNP